MLAAAMAGTAIEYYDFFLYGTAAALFFGPLFFPGQSAAAQTLLAFMTFGIAFIARPIGALAFGHFGDRIGRKATLVTSLLLMGGSTLGIAFLPTYARMDEWGAGWVAPALLCLMRFGQGFGLGGEWAGAALLAVENAPPGWNARFGAAPQLGVPLGFIAANGLFLLLGLWLDDHAIATWGWRIPFLVSGVLVALGLWVRLKIGETPAFKAALAQAPPEAMPLLPLIAQNWRAVLAGSAGSVAAYAIFYLATALAVAQATSEFGYAREPFLALQLLASLFLAAGTVLAAICADRFTPGRTIGFGACVAVPIGFAFTPALASGSLVAAGAILCVTLFFMAFANAPLGGWLTGLFPTRVRYSGVALAFNTGGIVGGAVFPVLAQGLSVAGFGGMTGVLLALAGMVTLAGVVLARRR